MNLVFGSFGCAKTLSAEVADSIRYGVKARLRSLKDA